MKLCFSILALCFLTGCPPVDEQKPVEKPAAQKPAAQKADEQKPEEESIDPFGWDALLPLPLEALPSAMPKHGKDISADITAENEVSYQSLEGTWYGGFFSPLSGMEVRHNRRVYLQFTRDKKFSYGCLFKDGETEWATLVGGKYSIEENELYLHAEPQKEGVESKSYMCEGSIWRGSQHPDVLYVPARHDG